jgi:iron complex outermembrane receptor protein
MFKYFVCLLLVLAGSFAFAQSPTIKGRVIDADVQEPLAGATVAAGDAVATTAADGSFTLTVAPGTTAITVTLGGYKVATVTPKGEANITIALVPINTALNEVQVEGYQTGRSLGELPASVARLGQADFARHNATTLLPVFNTVPGVKIDQSAMDNARLSIRGIGTRSQAGMRGIKVYYGDIPLTEADGFTRLEGIDLNTLGRAELIKGPASSLYGPANGGVLLLSPVKSEYGETSLEASTLAGSYGLLRNQFIYRHGDVRTNIVASGGTQNFTGYRAYNGTVRTNGSLFANIFLTDKLILNALANYLDESNQNPGGLTQAQFDADPTQQAQVRITPQGPPGPPPPSFNRPFDFFNAGRGQRWYRAGLSASYIFSPVVSAHLAVFGGSYNTDTRFANQTQWQLLGRQQSYGTRGRISIAPNMKVLPTIFIIGGEFQYGINYGLYNSYNPAVSPADAGVRPGPVTVDQRNDARYITAFAQTETKLTPRTLLSLGVGYNQFRYDITDYLVPGSAQEPGVRFTPIWRPRVALSHSFGTWMTARASYSTGFAPQLLSESIIVVNPYTTPFPIVGTNNTLVPESSEQWEVGIRGQLLGSRFTYDLAVYQLNMSNEIVTETFNFAPSFRNAGKTRRQGVELALSYNIIADGDQNALVKNLRAFVSYTYQDFRYVEFTRVDVYPGIPGPPPFGVPSQTITQNFDGNRMPGTSPHLVTAGVDAALRMGLYLNITGYFVDRQPLNDVNGDLLLRSATTGNPLAGNPTVSGFQNAYFLLNAKLGYQKRFGKFGVDVSAGVDNITSTRYAGFVRVNDNNGAYFFPSMPINYYGGAALKYYLR